mmetsp:Transcript_32292/g.102701  ORF Transcript_32292/g.102701 Transcript_32292/m.102701 type:complete len:267 (-) Transcript_32292:794-1594(-)
MLREHVDVDIRVELRNVLLCRVVEGRLALPPGDPLEVDVLEAAREGVAVVDGHEGPAPALGPARQHVGAVAVGVPEAHVEQADLVDLRSGERARAHLLAVARRLDELLEAAALAEPDRVQLRVAHADAAGEPDVAVRLAVDEPGGGHARESFVVEDERGHLADGPLPHLDPRLEPLPRCVPTRIVAPRIVVGQRLLVLGLEHRHRLAVGGLEEVGPPRAGVREDRHKAAGQPLARTREIPGQRVQRGRQWRRRPVQRRRGEGPRAV